METLNHLEIEFLKEMLKEAVDDDGENFLDTLKSALTGTDIVSNIMRKVAFTAISKLQSLLIKDFPSESLETFDTTEKVLKFTDEVLKFGASHVNRDRIFITGHQGSGKTSLSHSIRLIFI